MVQAPHPGTDPIVVGGPLEERVLIDAHSHIDRYDPVDERTLDSALAEISPYGVFTVSNSADLPSCERNLAIAERCRFVLPIFGVHPWNAPEYACCLEDLTPAIEQSPMLEEIGLDFHFVEDTSHYPSQRVMFSETARLSDFNLHHLIGTLEAPEYFVERHELGLFETEEGRGVLAEAGLDVTYDAEGLTGRGLFIGRRP